MNAILDICSTTDIQNWNGHPRTRLLDPTLKALADSSLNFAHQHHTPETRGHLLFEAAVASLRQSEGRYTPFREPKN